MLNATIIMIFTQWDPCPNRLQFKKKFKNIPTKLEIRLNDNTNFDFKILRKLILTGCHIKKVIKNSRIIIVFSKLH